MAVEEQCDVFINKMESQVKDDMKEAMFYLNQLKAQVSKGTRSNKALDKMRMLEMIMKMGEVFRKVPNGDQKQKCNFYNRGFCKKGILCIFAHPVRMCEKLVHGGRCDEVGCEDRHPKFCRDFEREGGCSWGLRCEFRHETIKKMNETQIGKVDQERPNFKLGNGGFGFDILEAGAAANENEGEVDHLVRNEVEKKASEDIKGNEDSRDAKGEKPSSSGEPEDVFDWALLNAENGEIRSEDLDLILESFDKKNENKEEKVKDAKTKNVKNPSTTKGVVGRKKGRKCGGS
jgi:hypothetical protein